VDHSSNAVIIRRDQNENLGVRGMTTQYRKVPPGPAENYDTADDLLRWMGEQFNRFGDTYRASIYGSTVYAVRDLKHVQHVLRENWQNYTKGLLFKRVALLLGNGIVVSGGELWKTQRRMIQPAFHRKSIGALADVIRTTNTTLLRRWEQRANDKISVNVTSDVSSMSLEVVLTSIFGRDYEQAAPHFRILSEESARTFEFAQAFRSLGKIVLKLVAQRRKENITSTDILRMLMEARDQQTGQAMPDRQLLNEILTLIVAGHETTASTLNWTWYLLSQHPEVEEKLSNELDRLPKNEFPEMDDLPKFAYTRQIIDETLRLYPAVWLLTRRALKDDQLGDYFVPAGTEIYISPYFIQRHPDLWEEPDRFNPDRFHSDRLQDRHPLATIPFSAGPRNCVGELLARTEMQIHLMVIAERLRLRFVGDKPPELDAAVNLRSKNDFIMDPQLKSVRGGSVLN
jgi:cytochrome P450